MKNLFFVFCPERLFRKKEWLLKLLGKTLLIADRVVFAHVGSGGSQPFDISVHPVHYTILIIYSIFNV